MARVSFVVTYEDGNFSYDDHQQHARFRECAVYDKNGKSHTGWQWDRDYVDFRAEGLNALSALLNKQWS